MNGMSTTNNARFTPRATQRLWYTISATLTGSDRIVALHHHAERIADHDEVHADVVHTSSAKL